MRIANKVATLPVLLAAACNGEPDLDDTTYPKAIHADVAGATALLLFGGGTERDLELSQGVLAKRLEDGTLEPVFPAEGWVAPDGTVNPPLMTLDLIASSSGIAFIRTESAWFVEYGVDPGPEAPGIWCNAFLFDTTVDGPAPLSCIQRPPPGVDCSDPAGYPCDQYPPVAYGLESDGHLWVEWNASGGVDLWRYDLQQGAQATPLPIPANGALFVDDNGASIETINEIEHYAFDQGSATMTRFQDVGFPEVGGTRPYLWGSRPVVNPPGGWGLLDHAEDRIIPYSELLHDSGCAPSASMLRSDGTFAYVPAVTDGYCRCDFVGCSAASEADNAALAQVWGADFTTDGLTTCARSSSQLRFLREGVISPNFASDYVVRNVLVLGGQLHVAAVNTQNEGGLFRVDFDGAEFSLVQVESYDTDIQALVVIDSGGE